ncbi:MAG TPA: DUF885 family protein [Acidimicrobiales bacterium]|nr:DUF885 family protein [Acidimicrobiales bacterium]
MNPRIDALCRLSVPGVREYAGLHRFDGMVQDLSPSGVTAALRGLGQGPVEPDPHDEAHLRAEEAGARATFGLVQEHRRNPLYHLDNLDLAVYDREYAPKEQRDEARRRHLASWPDAVDAAVEALDRVPADVAEALLPAARGLASVVEPGRTADPAMADAALAAHGRLVAHLEQAAATGERDASIGGPALCALMGEPNSVPLDLGRLARRADAERDRVTELLRDACARLAPGRAPAAIVAELARDHPDGHGIQAEARALIDEATAFTLQRDLLPDPGGECLVGPAPASRRWAMAMMSWSAPHEEDAPSWYYVTPPDPDWTPEEQEEWLAVFSRTTLPAITLHEVTPGHYAHGRLLRSALGDVRRTFFSSAFVEGWAHYAEELCLEEGFRAEDPRFPVGVCVEALVRISRLAVAIGLHTGAMTMDDAVRRFEADAFLRGPAARSEAARSAYDPTYGRYTWGKLEILSLRDEARVRWGRRYSHRRFHESLLSLGAPPLGLMGDALGDSSP